MMEIANAARVIAWAQDPDRKPATTAFTAGPERQAAYWIEWAWQKAQRKPLTDEQIRDALEAEFLGEPGGRNLADDLRVARATEAAHGIK